MKNLIFLLLLLSFALQGQESENTKRFILGGSVSGFTNTTDSPEREQINGGGFASTLVGSSSSNHLLDFRPYFGLIINQRSIVGARLSTGFSLRKFRFDNQDEDAFRRSTLTLGAGLFYRYYINPNNKFKVFIQPFADYEVINGETEQASPFFEEDRRVSFTAGVGLGLVFSLSEKWNLLANIWSVNYNRSNFKAALEEDPEIQSTLNADFSIRTISFGAELSF